MDNKNLETFEEKDNQIDGIVVYLLKKFAMKNELVNVDADLPEEIEA